MVFITCIQMCSCAQLVQRPEAQISNDLRWPVQHTALATARRDGTDAEQPDGCVQLRDLQLYRRPGGEPWLLGRGSNGMVCVTMPACLSCVSCASKLLLRELEILTGTIIFRRCSRRGAAARMLLARCSRWIRPEQAMRCGPMVHLAAVCNCNLSLISASQLAAAALAETCQVVSLTGRMFATFT